MISEEELRQQGLFGLGKVDVPAVFRNRGEFRRERAILGGAQIGQEAVGPSFNKTNSG